MTHTSNVTIHLGGEPTDVVLTGIFGLYPVLQIGTALTMHLDTASPAVLRMMATALNRAADAGLVRAVAA